ncbi:MAG: alpha/beta hydrolase [Bdellovibrionota bacterium]
MGHSLVLDHEMFDPQAKALSQKYRVIRLDFRCHGQSEKVKKPFSLEDYRDDVFAVADALGIGRFHWVGLSQGGMTGMRMALKSPGRIAGLVLLDTSADVENPATLPQYKNWNEQSRKMPPNEQMAKMGLQMTFFSPKFLGANPELFARYVQKLLANDREALYHATNAVLDRRSILEDIRKIKNPTLVMVGENDTATVPAKSEQIHEAIEGSALEKIPGAAHISTLENPEFVNEKLLTFFAGWEA